ncbi:MAG: amino acid permease [Chloroflexota bacterium]
MGREDGREAAAGERGAARRPESVIVRRGSRPGDTFVRIVRPHAGEFQRRAPGYLVATERVLRPTTAFGRLREAVRGLLLGRRIRSEAEHEERAGRLTGLAIFASDNISSSAYATEEIMRVLVLAGAGALVLTMPITLAIVVVLAIVVSSYLQVIRAYPGGGGSYVVAQDNLGTVAGLTAAAALLTDYILTVAVSTSAGVAALTSAFPELFAHRVAISVAVVALMALLNLRGIREAGAIFAAPTYLYVVAILGVLATGAVRVLLGDLPAYTPPRAWEEGHGAERLGLLLVLRAFASGSVALTGTEAVSNGVPAFKPPEVKNAQTVLVMMGGLFATVFVGLSFFATQLGIVPDPREAETVVSQVARLLVGRGPYYYLVQFATALLLVLAANTAFNGFPRLTSIVARDGFLPRQFQFRGDRLAYNTGIIVLALISAALIAAYRGSVTGLIPLYTVGVFVAFTLSQAGMVRHWLRLRRRERGWRWRAVVNGVGATVTGIVALEVSVSKFALGAWMVLVLIPLLVLMMLGIGHHYRAVARQLALDGAAPLPRRLQEPVVVPISRLDQSTLHALAFARSISNDVRAVHVTDDLDDAKRISEPWPQYAGDVPLVIIESPYRALIQPLLAYIDWIDRQAPGPITVVLSEFVPRHWWEYLLHNQTALRLKLRLFFRPNTVVIDVPYHLAKRPEPVVPEA